MYQRFDVRLLGDAAIEQLLGKGIEFLDGQFVQNAAHDTFDLFDISFVRDFTLTNLRLDVELLFQPETKYKHFNTGKITFELENLNNFTFQVTRFYPYEK